MAITKALLFLSTTSALLGACIIDKHDANGDDDDGPPSCGTPNASSAIATTQNEILSLAIANGQVYWLDMGGIGSVSAGAGGNGQEIVTSASSSVFAIGGFVAANGTDVFWANGDFPSGTVGRAPATGGTTQVVATTDDPIGVAVDANNLYWSTFGSSNSATGTIVSQPLAGGSPTVLASGLATVGPIAVDSTSVYFSDMFGAVSSVPIGGGAVVQLAPAQQALPADTILDDSPAGIAVANGRVYWTISSLGGGTPNAIDSVAITGGAVTTIARPATTPTGIAADDTFVYWSEIGPVTASDQGLGTPPVEDQGSVSRIMNDGTGTVQTLASGASAPVGPVLGENALYYATGASAGAIYQVIL